jgi:hypothetical protein
MSKILAGVLLVCFVPGVALAIPLPVLSVFSHTSAPAHHPSTTMNVPTGYQVIGGGAQVNYGTGAGNILTKSFPVLNGSPLPNGGTPNGWEGDSKDADISDVSTITVWAVAIKNPNWTVCSNSATSAATSWPVMSVQLPAGCALTGGGASANWSGAGSYLTASYPDTINSWRGAAKDHIHPDPSTMTVYVLGIKPASGPLPTVLILSSPFGNSPVSHPSNTVSGPLPMAYKIFGGGAVDYWGGAGNMLTASFPSISGMSPTLVITAWNGNGKDHEVVSPATLGAFAIALHP